MNLPGLLVEYLINGSVALIWLIQIPALKRAFEEFDLNSVLLIPILYVIGMFIDYVAWIITKPFKKIIRRRAVRSISGDQQNQVISNADKEREYYWQGKVEIGVTHPELKKELTSRSSRDRIARGTIINLIPILIFNWSYLIPYGLILFVLSILMWIRFEHYNHCFELRAVQSIRYNKENSEKTKN